MEDGGLWQICEATVNSCSSLLPQHTGMFGCMSSDSSSHAAAASFGHFEYTSSCVAAPAPGAPQNITSPLLPQLQSSPFRGSQWGFQYESWMSSPARVDELYDMMQTFIGPSSCTLVDTAAAATAFEHGSSALMSQQALPGSQAAAVIDLQDLVAGAWGHGIHQALSGEQQQISIAASGGGGGHGSAAAAAAAPDIMQQQGMMISDQYLQTLNSSSSPFNYHTLQSAAAESKMELSLGSVFDKVWNNSKLTDNEFGAVTVPSDSLITNPMGSMFHSISTGSLMYLQNKCCEALEVMTKPAASRAISLQVSGGGCTEAVGVGPAAAIASAAQEIQKVPKGLALLLANSQLPGDPAASLMKNIASADDDDDDDDASSAAQNLNTKNTVSSVQKQNGNKHVGSLSVPQGGPFVTISTVVESCETTLQEASLSAGQQLHRTWFPDASSENSSNKISANSNSKVMVSCSEERQFCNGFRRTTGDQPVITKWQLPPIVALPPPLPPPGPPLEAKQALPAAKYALPPLAVVKCALPRSSSGHVTSNGRKRPLWPANTNNMSGSPKMKPIAKWPPGVEGCSRLEAVSTLAHHTVTQNTSTNPRALGPALNTNLKPRARQGSANDPQSIAARVRRERISERLKALQLLVPNGDKVDMVTMLEKAINYVQCLELQIRMLKDDTLWPKALGALPNTLQELLELAGPELAALQEEEQNRKKKRRESIEEDDPLSSPTPSSDNTE